MLEPEIKNLNNNNNEEIGSRASPDIRRHGVFMTLRKQNASEKRLAFYTTKVLDSVNEYMKLVFDLSTVF